MVGHLFGSPLRPLDDAARRQVRFFQEVSELRSVLDALPHVVLILNDRREVVFGNRYLLDVLQLDTLDRIFGRPPGELLDCVHAFEDGGGCGLNEACEACGTNRTIGSSRQGERAIHECRILQRGSGRALDMQVAGTPVHFAGECFTILALTDISNEKRRQALERIFFHDLLNVATGISAFSAVLARSTQADVRLEAVQSINRLVHQLAEEINAQRELNEAENNELQVHPRALRARELVESILEAFRGQPIAEQRTLCIDPVFEDGEFVGDRVLLTRVLGNMIKNGLEASAPGESVTVGSVMNDHRIEFRVHNPREMPRDVQLQIFQRSFSTKGRGRGLGTYSIRLLTERYLQGRVWFISTAEEGTTFHASYPRDPVAG